MLYRILAVIVGRGRHGGFGLRCRMKESKRGTMSVGITGDLIYLASHVVITQSDSKFSF